MGDVTDLLDVLDLDPVAAGRFVGRSVADGGASVFGGQLLGQAIVAATRAVPGKEVQSVSTVFARGARTEDAIELDVEPVHDGRSFASAAVTIRQGERQCARAIVLLHVGDDDLIRHAIPMPEAEDPGGLTVRDHLPGWEIRTVGDVDVNDTAVGPAALAVWSRFPDAPNDPVLGQALLAYATDGFLIATAMRPHPGLGQSLAHVTVATTVLAHTINFHEPVDATSWLLIDQESAYSGRGRAHGDGRVFRPDGALVATFSQESMIRAGG